MAKSYKVSVFAGTKVVADMAQQVKNATIDVSLELKPITGGATEATAVLLPVPNPLPVNSNRKRTKAIGWYKNATGPAWEAPKDADNVNWWSFETGLWSLGSSVPLPKQQGVNTINPIGSGLPTEKATADYIAPIAYKVDNIGKEIIPFNPTSNEMTGDTTNSQFGIGYIFNVKNLTFDKIEGYILGSNANADIVLNVYLLDSIPIAGNLITLPSPILTQQFKAGTSASPIKTIVLTKTIESAGKYPFITFKNIIAANTVTVQRKSNRDLPTDSVYAIGVVNSTSGTPDNAWAVNTYTFRFTGLKLYLGSNLLTKENLATNLPPVVSSIKDNLKTDSGYFLMQEKGSYGSDNAVYSFKTNKVANGNSYLGVEFRFNEDINIAGADKKLFSIKKGTDFIDVIIEPKSITNYEQKQILLYRANDTTPQWDFITKYPMPFYNTRIVVKTNIGGTESSFAFPLRNPRDYKPLCGKDAFMLQFKPTAIRTGGKIYANQAIYQSNQNWFLSISESQLTIYNDDLGVNKVFLFSVYPYVDQLFAAILKETKTGVLTDFIFNSLNTGGISNSSSTNHKDSAASNSLLKCTLKLVDKYPYDGIGSNPTKTAYDSWPCVIPYAIDDSWHSLEFATKSGNAGLMVTFDGKPIQDGQYGYLRNMSIMLSESNVTVGDKTTGVNCTFKNLESYFNSLNGYDVSFHHYLWNFIASAKNPRIVGVMWHDVIPSTVVGRNTSWTDIPKEMRLPFSTIVTRGDYKINLLKGIDFELATSVGNDRYQAVLTTGETIEGIGTITEGAVSSIAADKLIAGDWSTAIHTKEWEGLIGRVGADLLHTTSFLDQIFTDLLEKGYKTVTYKQVNDFIQGRGNLPSYKCFAPQWDDFTIYMFTNQDIFKILKKHNVTLSVAWDLSYHKNRSTGVVDEGATDVLRDMMYRGHEAVIHNHWSYTTQFVKSILSDDAERAILESIDFAKKHFITEFIWDESANLSTPNSLKLMELCGIDCCISTQNYNTTRATNKMYLSRGSLNPNVAPSWYPIV
ncbi:hypothetical protein I6I99_10905 [Sphingobacterium multivorum]|nr:hypothetical protein [Sphingobacterium multivorum]QQT33037.1 hypothetical protein I6I99_10905 [Sphingobacterium multivorum]